MEAWITHTGRSNYRALVAMVFARAAFSETMRTVGTRARLVTPLPCSRLIARSRRTQARAGLSSVLARPTDWACWFMAITFVFVARALLSFVRPSVCALLALVILPFAIWIGLSPLLYYVNSLVIACLRRLGLYSAVTNNPFQHVVIMSLISLIALHPCVGKACLGKIVRRLLAGTLVRSISSSILLLRFLHEA